MSTPVSNSKKTFNLPAYINIPKFLYLDFRLEKPATLIAGFFYSIHTSGLDMTASTDYLCALAGVHKRRLYKILKELEDYKYIERSGFTNRKTTKWIYNPKSKLIVEEQDASALECTTVQSQNTSALQCTKLVHSSALNYCTPVHKLEDASLYDTKEDTKDNKKLTTTAEKQSSSSFFSSKQKEAFLKHKLKSDTRTDEEFIEHCRFHIEDQVNEFTKYKRVKGLLTILEDVADAGEHFIATNFGKLKAVVPDRPPTDEEFNEWKRCTPGYDWVGAWRSKNLAQG